MDRQKETDRDKTAAKPRRDNAKENGKKSGRDNQYGEPGLQSPGIRAAAGPAGTLISSAVGAVIGPNVGPVLGGKTNPTQLGWWEENYATRSYVKPGSTFDMYESAYRSGIEAARDRGGRDFEDLAPSIRNNWNIARGHSPLEWHEARQAAEDAFRTCVGYSLDDKKLT